MRADTIPEISRLSTAGKILLVDDLWDSIAADAAPIAVLAEAKHELSEVLASRRWDSLIGVGELEHRFVVDPRRQLGDIDDVAAVRTQTSDNRGVDAFVGRRLHATDLETGSPYPCSGFCPKCSSGLTTSTGSDRRRALRRRVS